MGREVVGEKKKTKKSNGQPMQDFTNSFSHNLKFAKVSELSVTPAHLTCNPARDNLRLFSPVWSVRCTNHTGVEKPKYILKTILVNSCGVKVTKACMNKYENRNKNWRKLRLTPSRLEKRPRQTFRLELVSLDSSQISCIFCNTGDGNPERTNKWISVNLYSGLKPI